MTAERTRERCGDLRRGRRPELRYYSPACRRAAAREREAHRAPLAVDPPETMWEGAAPHAHGSCAALQRLEDRLDELAPHLSHADARLMARAMLDALSDGGDR